MSNDVVIQCTACRHTFPRAWATVYSGNQTRCTRCQQFISLDAPALSTRSLRAAPPARPEDVRSTKDLASGTQALLLLCLFIAGLSLVFAYQLGRSVRAHGPT